jgi:hypothetical protein
VNRFENLSFLHCPSAPSLETVFLIYREEVVS